MGLIVLIALYAILYIISGKNMSLTDFLLAEIAVGFIMGGNIKDGAINSAIVGVIWEL